MLEPFAARIAALSYEALDEDILDAARLRLFDTLIANAIGLTIEDGRRLAALAANAGPGDRLAETVRLNVGATRATEVDDINIAACATVGSVVIPVAVGLGAARGLDDQAVLAAIVAGYEAMISLGTAVDGASLLYKGVWPTYATAPFAAAAVGASLLGLDARGTANALSLALARTSTLTGRAFDGATPRWRLLGCAAAEGMLAAQAAAAGLGGDPGLLTAFASAIGAELNPSALLASERPRILEMDCKPFPTARQGLAVIQAFRQLHPSDRSADEIARIEVFAPAASRSMIGRTEPPGDRIASLSSVAYQMALAALAPDRLDDVARDTILRTTATDAFLAKVEVNDAADLSAIFPGRWAGRVTVHWHGGETASCEVRDPDGSAARPFGWAALRAKGGRLFGAAGLDQADLTLISRLCSDFGVPGGSRAGELATLLERLAGLSPTL